MEERARVYVATEEETIISSIFCEQDSLSPKCQEVINLVKEFTSILQASKYDQNEGDELLKKLKSHDVTVKTIRTYLLCNLTLRETLRLNRHTRDCWILALKRTGFSEKQIAHAIQLGKHFAARCKKDPDLEPFKLVTQTIIHRLPPAGLRFPIPTI